MKLKSKKAYEKTFGKNRKKCICKSCEAREEAVKSFFETIPYVSLFAMWVLTLVLIGKWTGIMLLFGRDISVSIGLFAIAYMVMFLIGRIFNVLVFK